MRACGTIGRMARLRCCVWLLLGWSLLGCDRAAAPDAPTTMPLPGGVQVAWQGVLACADCDGIRTRLVLARSGDQRRYTLTETYLAQDGDIRFVEEGGWTRERDLLRLQGAAGGIHVYALMSDGWLQPRDGRGRAFSPRENDFLLPVTTTPAR